VGSLRKVEAAAIAHVTPYPWETHHEVNQHVERLADGLCARGHRVLVLAPTASSELVAETRRALRAARTDPDSLFDAPGCVRVLGVGEVLALSPRRRSSRLSVPIDVARTIEELLEVAPLDVVHVHEPWAPSAASAALRHSRALNVGTFHAPAERMLATQVARRFVELFFGRLDARTASWQATADLVARHFPGRYEVIHPGADAVAPAARPAGPLRILLCVEEERSATRVLLRALRRLPAGADWEATIWSRAGERPTAPISRAIAERVIFAGPRDGSEAEHLARADVVVLASAGASPAPGLALRALRSGAIPVASCLPVYREALGDGELGLLYDIGDPLALAAQLTRLIEDEGLRGRLAGAGSAMRETLDWSRAVDAHEAVYERLLARRREPRGDPVIQKRLAGRRLIDVDLHMHTDHSPDCATPVDVLLATAREQGLGAIAITDHNEVSGAFEALEKADRYGVKVIVAEEVKSASQGEVIGLFLEQKIPRGLTLQETIAEIRRQGGLVYVPHPFDRLHAVPDYEHLLDVLDDVDALEVFNPRVAIGAFNEEAVRFAAKYRIIAGAGSDAHVAQGLGSVRIRMRDFDGPEEFLESLREADIAHKPTSLVYVQALKFLQTKAMPGAARASSRERRIRRATRNS
jgi:predicted metal-dependent phosphoesterase TrpH/glycosyltransferase involved in cell wall biosynthesis